MVLTINTNTASKEKAFAEYAHKFGVHDIDIMAGAEQSHYHRTTYNFGSGIDEYLRDTNPELKRWRMELRE